MPLDMNILKALKRSSLGLDIYLWLVYRTFALKKPKRISPGRASTASSEWTRRRLGDNITVQNFRKDCLRELIKIKAAWPDLNYATGKGVLILSPSTPSIPPTRQLSLVE